MASPFVFEIPLFFLELEDLGGWPRSRGTGSDGASGAPSLIQASRGFAGRLANALRIEDGCREGGVRGWSESRSCAITQQSKQELCSSYVRLHPSTAPSGSVVAFINQVALLGRLLFRTAGIFF